MRSMEADTINVGILSIRRPVLDGASERDLEKGDG